MAKGGSPRPFHNKLRSLNKKQAFCERGRSASPFRIEEIHFFDFEIS